MQTSTDYKSAFLISPDNMNWMLEAQEEMNRAYTGEDWKVGRKDVKINSFMFAAADEFSEFLSEVRPIWKWWDKRSTLNRNDAAVELIDMTHFMLSIILLKRDGSPLDIEGNVHHVKTRTRWPSSQFYQEKFVGLKLDLMGAWVDFQTSATNPREHVNFLIQAFLRFHMAAFEILDITGSQGVEIYAMKRERNFKRVADGVLDGVDVKSQEKTLQVL